MERLLLDVSLAEGYSVMVKDSLHHPGAKNFDSLAVYYNSIFAHYKISESQFSENLDYYKGHPEDLDTMYNNMLTTITKLQAVQGGKKL